MKALVWHGKEDIRCDTVTDPEIEDPRDAIVKVTSCAICGSDLHLFHNFIPAMLPGDIMGHEMMGEVVEVGRGVNGKLKKGDRVVVPFTISCGGCFFCRKQLWSLCDNSNPGRRMASIHVAVNLGKAAIEAVRKGEEPQTWTGASSSFDEAMKAAESALKEIRQRGTQGAILDRMQTRRVVRQRCDQLQ